MSQFCPLCGKNKSEDALFCADCTKKMRAEYEVDVPDTTDSTVGAASPKKEGDGLNMAWSEEKHQQDKSSVRRKKKKRIWIPILLLLLVALLTGGFFFYNETVRKDNLDRGAWETAVKTNSVEGYLAYIKAHPNGAHFEEAQDGLRRLKEDEALAWERMREGDNVTELRDFLHQHAGSPYEPLVRRRLDSLSWVAALQVNTGESYSDYIRLTEKDEIKGDYIAEAQKRYDMLRRDQSMGAQPLDSMRIDSIRTAVDGFFIALSSLEHDGLFRFLAPSVERFFDSGAASRDRIVGELVVTGAKADGVTLKFIPDLDAAMCEAYGANRYRVNVPLQKNYPKGGATQRVFGYIAHLEMDSLYQVVSIYETKPYPEAP